MEIVNEDDSLVKMIGEMMFEMHYNSTHVNQWFGYSGGNKTWHDVMNLFQSLRHRGLRLHYWP